MEHHRLKPMTDGYDKSLFDEIYKKTTPLRRKLAYEIDSRKFGVDYDEVLSWFDVKFIHSFNKFTRTFKKEDTQNFDGKLMGYIINALSTYKYRVMRSSYQVKYHEHKNMVDISTYYENDDIKDTSTPDALVREAYMEKIMEYMKKELSDDALLILDIQLNPPAFISSKLEELGKKEYTKIPNDILADYLNMPLNNNVIQYLDGIKADIRRAIINARSFFTSNPFTPQLS